MIWYSTRRIAFLTFGLLLTVGCDKDYTPVKSFHQDLPTPTMVEAELLSNNRVAVTWDVTDPTGVVQGFVVSIEDATAPFYEKLVTGASTRRFTTDFELLDAVPPISSTSAD